jgi:two-component system, NtrC family, response regulator AtoC
MERRLQKIHQAHTGSSRSSVMQNDLDRKEKIIQIIDFNLNVIRLMLGNTLIHLSEKAKEKVIQNSMNADDESTEMINHSELEFALETAAKKCKNNVIEPDDIIFKLINVNDLSLPTGLKLEDLERKYILQTLYFAEQNRTKAADILGISIRTLRNKINQYRLEGFL